MSESEKLNKQFDNAKRLANSLPTWMKEIGQERVQSYNQEVQTALRKESREASERKTN